MLNTDQHLMARRQAVLGRYTPLFYDEPVQLVKGDGVWVYDAQGKRYLDVYNNVPHVGHCHPHVVKAMVKQASTLNTHTRYLHDNVISYAERLTATFDSSLSGAMFTCTGSEANELALRMARYCTGGTGIIVTDLAYHGNTEAVAEVGTAFMPEAKTTRRVKSFPSPDSYHGLDGLQGDALADAFADKVQDAIDAFSAEGIKLAGILICPDFANEGLLTVPKGFIEKAVAKVRAAGGLYITDEVQAGFGRSGTNFWAHQAFDVTPDIVTMGKPMGNGHPLAGVVARLDLIEEFSKTAMYFNTFGGSPVSTAIGMAVLDVLEQENLQQNALKTGSYVTHGLQALQQKHAIIGDVRNLGMFFALELVSDKQTKTPAPNATNHIVNYMRHHGVLISRIGRHNNVLKMRPPMPFYQDHADLLLERLDEALATIVEAN